MFQFPGFAAHDYVFIMGYTSKRVGFPIRTSPSQCLFADSSELIAGYYVLHRLLSPRHPPCALGHLVI